MLHEASAREGARGSQRERQGDQADPKRARKQTHEEKEVEDDSESSTATRSASSEGSTEEDEEEEPTNEASRVLWVLPAGYKTRVHASDGTRTADGRVVPLCRKEPFSWASETGVGLAAADATGRKKHAACWSRCGIAVTPDDES